VYRNAAMSDRGTVLAQIAHYRKLAESCRKKAEAALSPAVKEHHLAIARGFESIADELEASIKH
jgi:hypothetical protein